MVGSQHGPRPVPQRVGQSATGAVGEARVEITGPNRDVNIDPDHEPRCTKACIGHAARRSMVGQNAGR
jgi:hypothetical protein